MQGKGIKDNADASVGYGKPPKHTQFKKGKSGNPKGRPPAKSFVLTVLDVLEEEIDITLNGEKQTVTKKEALVQALLTAALNGKPSAMKSTLMLIKQLPEYPGM